MQEQLCSCCWYFMDQFYFSILGSLPTYSITTTAVTTKSNWPWASWVCVQTPVILLGCSTNGKMSVTTSPPLGTNSVTGNNMIYLPLSPRWHSKTPIWSCTVGPSQVPFLCKSVPDIYVWRGTKQNLWGSRQSGRMANTTTRVAQQLLFSTPVKPTCY